MSETKDQFMSQLQEHAEFEKTKDELQRKRVKLDKRRIDHQLEQVEEFDRNAEKLKSISFGALDAETISKLQKENTDYFNAAKNSMSFIHDVFMGFVPFFRKNLIFVGGKTGQGKSTTVANIVSSVIRQVNPETGKLRRALVITNEEKSEDVYNRLVCHAKGWHYVNHDQFTDEQKDTFNKMLPLLAAGRVTVIDDCFGGLTGLTTSLEGIESIFEKLIADKEWYDVVLIDYYQNVKLSKKDQSLNEFEVQAKLAYMLDKYKNLYPAPIVVLGQIKPEGKDEAPFEIRIKGSKAIFTVSTCSVELVAEKARQLSHWVVHKSRFNNIGTELTTGYDRGKFVPYDTAFQNKVLLMLEQQEAAKRLKGVFKKEEEKNDKG